MPKFSLIIPTYSSQNTQKEDKNVLYETLNAIKNSSVKPEKVIIVDDNPQNNISDTISKYFPNFTYIRNLQNFGPTKSRNIGAKEATGDYLAFLDDDIIVQSDTFERLISFIRNNKNTGACGAQIVSKGQTKGMYWNAGWNPNHLKLSIGYFIGFLLKIFKNNEFLKKHSIKFILNYWDYDKIIKIDWVVEGCFIVRNDVFKKINGYDENFFMGHENMDLCRRIKSLGYNIIFNPEITVFNQEKHTHQSLKRKKWLLRGEYYYYQKHYFPFKSNPILFLLGRAIAGLLYLIS